MSRVAVEDHSVDLVKVLMPSRPANAMNLSNTVRYRLRVDALEQILGSEPEPELAAQFAEEFTRRLDDLPDNQFRLIALWRLEGYTNREIADKLGTYEVKIERKLRIIRKRFSREEPDDEWARGAYQRTDGFQARPEDRSTLRSVRGCLAGRRAATFCRPLSDHFL